MTRDEMLNKALVNLQKAELKVGTMNTMGEAADAGNLRVRIARAYMELAIELGRKS